MSEVLEIPKNFNFKVVPVAPGSPLKTTSNSGDTIFHVDLPTGEIYTLAFDGGLLFPKGVFCKTITNVTGFTLFSDKYSAAGLTAG